MKTSIQTSILCLSLLTASIHAQTNLNFNSIIKTEKGSVRLSWESKTNEVYQIEYADELIDSTLGSTDWKPLYDDYPSHGTNTFITDSGNLPAVTHPKNSPKRFYRVFLVQENDSPTNPVVNVTFPTNGATLSGELIMQAVASSSEILSEVKLYIDGEEQWSSEDDTNFVVNTCEWPNGPHTIYAIAYSQSGEEGGPNGGVITYGRTVSSYVNVTFDNLISKLDFSEPFFQPGLGQTQKVSAVFSANVDWTLEIQNEDEQDVLYVTGSGTSMEYLWDGTGTNGVVIPNGVYSYLLTAQTNGGAMLMSGGSINSAYSLLLNDPSFAEKKSVDWFPTSAKEALASGSPSFFISAPPMPPVVTNIGGQRVTIPWAEIYGEPEPIEIQIPTSTQEGFLSLLEDGPQAAAYEGPSSQSTRGPKDKEKVGVKGPVGTFGVCYLTYGKSGFFGLAPLTGWPFPLQTRVAIDGRTPTAAVNDYRVKNFKPMAKDFAARMTKGGWEQKFLKKDGEWTATDIKKTSLGGNSIFNTVNFGVLMTHGSFDNNTMQGNEVDGVKYTYCWLGPDNYVKLTDMDFGSSGTNGLKWMTLFACSMLKKENYDSMNNNNKNPVNENLHLLIGFSTDAWATSTLGKYYANNLLNPTNTIAQSFRDACSKAYDDRKKFIHNEVKVAVVGTTACLNDKLKDNSEPDEFGLQYEERIVFTPSP